MRKSTAFLLLILGSIYAQERSISGGGSRNRDRFSAGKSQVVGFNCPEDFGYYPHPTDCGQYYVCVFGGALLESCTGGLMYSNELQTCDWPRNVQCNLSKGPGISTVQITDPRTSSRGGNQVLSATESFTSASLKRGVDNTIRTKEPLKSSGSSKSVFDDSARLRSGRFILGQESTNQNFNTGFQAQETSSRSFNVVAASPSPKFVFPKKSRKPRDIRRRQHQPAFYDPDGDFLDISFPTSALIAAGPRDPDRDIRQVPSQGSGGLYHRPQGNGGFSQRPQNPFFERPSEHSLEREALLERRPFINQREFSPERPKGNSFHPFGNDDRGPALRNPPSSFSPHHSQNRAPFDNRQPTFNNRPPPFDNRPPFNVGFSNFLRPPPPPPRPQEKEVDHRPKQSTPTFRIPGPVGSSHFSMSFQRPTEGQSRPFVEDEEDHFIQDNRPPHYEKRPPHQDKIPPYQNIRPSHQDSRPPHQDSRPLHQDSRPLHQDSRPPHLDNGPSLQDNRPQQFVNNEPQPGAFNSNNHRFTFSEQERPRNPDIDVDEQLETPNQFSSSESDDFRPAKFHHRPATSFDHRPATSFDHRPRPEINVNPPQEQHEEIEEDFVPPLIEGSVPLTHPELVDIRDEGNPVAGKEIVSNNHFSNSPGSNSAGGNEISSNNHFSNSQDIKDQRKSLKIIPSKASSSPNNLQPIPTRRPPVRSSTPTPEEKPKRKQPVRPTVPKFPSKPKRNRNKDDASPHATHIPGTARQPESSKILPTKGDKDKTDKNVSDRPPLPGASTNRFAAPTAAPAVAAAPASGQSFYSDLLNLNDTDYYYYYDDILYDDYYEPSVKSVTKPPARSSSRGSSSSLSSTKTTSQSGIPELAGKTPQRLIRPSKKPPPVSPRGPLITDIWNFPPRRPAPQYPQPQVDSLALPCDPAVCRLPDCYCGQTPVPGNIPAQNVPQMVLLTFDDSVNDLNKKLYVDLFEKGRVNPNGCPIASTMYVSHEWTDYSQVQNLYSDGHEIASHSITHSFGEKFSTEKWAKEVGGQREIMSAYGGVRMEDIRGMRAPFLAIGGNNMFRMLYDLNFTYDSSMPVYENRPPSWPYTLDYKIFHDCMIPPCPTHSYPGVWQVPMVMWQDLTGGRCSMGDACTTPADAEGVYKFLIKNFERHYTTNRSPLGLYYHAAWFTTPHHKEGFIAFLDTITAMDDVWLVTNWQALQWVRNPVPLSQAKSFKPFQCDYPERPPRCTTPKVCNVRHKGSVRYLKTCQQCPEYYPWVGNTGVQSPLNDI